MDEVEQHIKREFTRMECSFLEEWSGPLGALPAPFAFEAIVRLLWRISPSLKDAITTYKLPPSSTAKFRAATAVTEAVKKVGVRAELGFQTLLYGGGKELASIFIELIRLAAENDANSEESDEDLLSPRDDVIRRARAIAASDTLWVPEFCRVLKLQHDGRYWCPGEDEPELYPLGRAPSSIPWSSSSTQDSRTLLAALLARSSLPGTSAPAPLPVPTPVTTADAAAAAGKPRIAAKPQLPPKPSSKPPLAPKPSRPGATKESEEKAQLNKKREQLEDVISALRQKRTALADLKFRQELLANREDALSQQLAEYDERLMHIYEDPEKARVKLEKFLEERDARVASMEQKWEVAKEAKLAELSKLKQSAAHMASAASAQEEQRAAEEKIAYLNEESESLRALEIKLARRLEKMSGDRINRHQYVKRIFDITASLRKQRQEASKVWKETDVILKDIKWDGQSVNRTFDILEETFYRKTEHSPKDERLYKNFVRLHSQCQLLIKTVESIGQKKTKCELLEDKYEALYKERIDRQIESVVVDLYEMHAEYEDMAETLRANGIEPPPRRE